MQEQKFIKIFRTAKVIQLCILLAIELIFFLILTYNSNLSRHIYSNRALFTLCAITWIVMIFNLFCLLYDFYKLRSFASESHALTQTAYLDNLTGIPNRNSLDVIAQNYTTPESLQNAGCAMITIDNLKETNDRFGHQTGDQMIQDFCVMFEEIGDSYGFVGRNGGNQFVVILETCSKETLDAFFQTLENRVSLYNTSHSQTPIQLKYAGTLCAEETIDCFSKLITATYNKLYQNL